MTLCTAGVPSPGACGLREHGRYGCGRQQLHERHVLPDPDPDSESDGGKTLKGDKHAGESEETDDDDPFPCYDVSTDEACF